MRSIVNLLFLALVATSCVGVKIQQHNLPCHSRNKAQVVQSAAALLVQHGFKITMADTLIGLVQAETDETFDIWSGTTGRRVWQISLRRELGPITTAKPGDNAILTQPTDQNPLFVVATAKTVTQSKNAFGATLASAEHYYDDKAHKDWEWYWGVRQGLESVCDAKVVITTKKMN